MGGIFSIQLSGEYLIRMFSSFCGQSYIQNLKQNLKDLETEIADLKAVEHAVRNKVAIEERQPRQQMTEGVKLWLSRVEKTEAEYNTLLEIRDEELQKLCLCDLGSKNVCTSYKYGKRVFLLLENVKKLKLDGKFEVVTEQTSNVGEMPIGRTTGHEIMLDKAWKRLMEDETGIMGLHGMGGVGKTTLFKKIYNKFTAYKDFNVIWVVVSRGVTISKIQDDIAEKLYISDEGWKNKNESDKAIEIHRVLKQKKFVLMLDDIWKEVNLEEAIGVPRPTRENGCKVAFTTRFRDVCVQMGDHEPMQVKCLETEDAWKLFEDIVGANTLRNDSVIEQLARKIVEKCGGLPLALNIIGKTMASKDTVQEWEHAVDVLARSALEYPDIENILSILKYSYDSLRDEHIKSCFLYCSLFPEDAFMAKEDLIYYWIGEGFMGESSDIKKARNKGYEIMGTLIRANLLKNCTLYVRMHDVVREMALWIASDFVVQTRAGLDDVPKLKDWGAVRRMSLIGNKIEEISCGSKCSELTTLFLRYNNLKNLSGEFIQSMQKLVVLDLSENRDFNTLPEEISLLVSLKSIDLSYTSIEQLPVGFEELKNLIALNLSYTSRLCSIAGISKLLSLKFFNLEGSKVHGDITLSKELQHLKHLQVLGIPISTELGLEQILCNRKLANCIVFLHILDFKQKPFNISLLVDMENLRYLMMVNSFVSENITDMKHKENTSLCFSNLTTVMIRNCAGIKDLTWLLYAPNLVYLFIEGLEEVEEIINKEKATKLTGITPFHKLERLCLYSLPQLKSIYWSPLPFPSLMELYINCPKLRKLPFNASSAPRAYEFYIDLSSQQQLEFEWEDEETKARFLPFTTNMYTTDNDSTKNSDNNTKNGDDNSESGDDNTKSGDDTE